MDNIPDDFRAYLRRLLTEQELSEIIEIQSARCEPGRQVLWTGITREQAQSWADGHDMQTLTTVMGPLMDPSHTLFAGRGKGHEQWVHYIHGASAILAWYISQGDVVTVLANPPPEMFNPSENTSFQQIEGPIIAGKFGRPVGEIRVFHPLVPGARDFSYQIWPCNEVNKWKRTGFRTYKHKWRKTRKSFKDSVAVLKVSSAGSSQSSAETLNYILKVGQGLENLSITQGPHKKKPIGKAKEVGSGEPATTKMSNKGKSKGSSGKVERGEQAVPNAPKKKKPNDASKKRPGQLPVAGTQRGVKKKTKVEAKKAGIRLQQKTHK